MLFHVLKNACRVETLQLSHMDRVERALVLYMVVSWRIARLMRSGFVICSKHRTSDRPRPIKNKAFNSCAIVSGLISRLRSLIRKYRHNSVQMKRGESIKLRR